MARSTWRGAIDVGGFPVHVALYNRVKSRAGESFRMLAPNGQPVSQCLKDTEGNEVERSECGRGVEVAPGKFARLTDEQIELIGKAERSVTLKPEQFCPVNSIPFELGTSSYVVTADSKVPGSEDSTNVLWNGLRGNKLAYVTRITIRSGSRDSILVIYPDEEGLLAIALPYLEEMHELPRGEFKRDKRAADLFKAFIESSGIEVKDFDHTKLHSEYKRRREQVLAQVLSGKAVEVVEAKQPDKADLMAVLEQSVSKGSKPKPKARKPKARKAKKAKAAA